MGIETRTLEARFEIDTGDSVADLQMLGDAAGKASADMVRDFNRMEAAARGLTLGDAASGMSAFGSVTTRAMREAERAAEGMSRSLDRQIVTFGMSADEVRRLNVETKALAAATQGYTELADRLRGQEATLTALRDRSAQAAAAEAAAVRKAADEHARLTALVRGANAAQEADHASLERLRASTDPLYVATKRLNDELAESVRLYHAGVTPQAEYARQQAVLTGRLQSLGAASDHTSTAIGKSNFALKQTAMQIPDIVTGLLTGQKPLQVLLQQGGQIVQIGQMAEGGLKGFGLQLGSLALKFGPIAAALAVVTVGVGRWHKQLEDDAGLKAYANSLGLTHKEMKKLGDVSITTGDMLKGLWKTVSDGLDLGGTGKKIIDYLFGPNDLQIVGNFMSSVYGIQVGGYNAIIATWRQFPAALGDLFTQAANFAIGRVNWLVNKVIDGVNALGLDLGHVNLAPLQNAWAGTAKTVGATFASEIKKATDQANGAMAGFFSKVGANAAQAARDRLKARASEIIADRTPKADHSAEEAARKAAAAQRELEQALNGLIQKFDPARAAAMAYSEAVDTVAKLTRAGMLTAGQESEYLARANLQLTEALNKVDEAKAAAGIKIDVGNFDRLLSGLDRVNLHLSDQGDLWADISRRANEAADNMQRAFGRAGGSIGEATALLAQYGKQQKEIDDAVARGDKKQADGIKASADLQLSTMIGLTSAAKGLFKEHSKGYEAMVAAEKALTVVQLARTAVAVAEGAATIFGQAGIGGFPFVAAMLGVMASLGFSGGGNAGSAPTTNSGTGTTLGDSTAKSDSLARSIALLGDIDHATMVYSGQMLTALKSIDSKIGGFASLIVRAGDVNASAGISTGFKTDTTGNVLSTILTGAGLLNGVPIIGDILGGIGGVIKSLFGTKTSVVGSGLYGGAQSLGDIVNGGFDASYYSDVKKTKKFFGISTGSSYSTQYSAADPSLENQFTLILRQFDQAIAAAAGPLGVATGEVENRLNSFVVNIGKIDLKDLTGDEIQAKLEAVFGAAADNIAAAAIPGLEQFQSVGEGYFETLVRVASTAEAVTNSLDELGFSTQSLGVAAKVGLAGMFDSVSDMQSQVETYFSTYYTEAEQAAAKTAQLGKVFSALGVTLPDSIATYRALVDAQDLTTTAGQQMYAQLIQLAPAFADITAGARDATSAAAIVREQQDLQRQLLELQGNTAAIRAAQIATLDPSNRALQEQIYAIQDAQEAAKAADTLRQAWTSVGDSIMDEVKRIRGLGDATGTSSFAMLQGQFNAATASARIGDQDAAKLLPGLSKSLLDAAALVATSRQELDRVQAQTASSLEATYAAIKSFGETPATTAATAATVAAAQTSASTAAANDDLVAAIEALQEEVAQLRAENNAGNATIAGNTGSIKKTLDNVTAGSGGEAIAVASAA